MSAEIESSEPQVNPMVHVIAPIVAFGATMLVRKVLTTGYRLVTGSEAPDTRDPQVKFTRALTWTIITAATAAVVEVEVYRFVNKRGEHSATSRTAVRTLSRKAQEHSVHTGPVLPS